MIVMRPRPATGRVAALTAAMLGISLLVLPQGAAFASATPTISAVPAVTHVGRTITITGSGLEDANSVALNGTPLTDVVAASDGSQVQATVPAGATSGPIEVTTTSAGDVLSTDTVTVAAPPVVTGLDTAVGDRVAIISWTSAGTGPTIVRDVTGVTGPLTTTSGREIAVTGLQARDTAFTNTTSRTYAVWATDADTTPSDGPATKTQDPQPAVPTEITLSSSYTSGVYPLNLALSGQLSRAGLPLPNQPVQVWSGLVGSAPTLLRTVTTLSNGTYRTLLVPSRSRTYSVRFPGDTFSAPSVSPTRVVSVIGRVTAAWNPTVIRRGQLSLLSGRVLPPVSGVLLTVQRRVGTSWVSYAHPRTLSDGSYRIALAPPLGAQVFRVVRPALPGLTGAISPATSLRVEPRDLSDGMSGADVLGLQRRLTAMHYDPGPLDGRYSYSTHHAVMTFQKVERLRVTGFWGTAERTRASHPHAWQLRYPSAGRAVEVDVTRQVLVLSQAGRVLRIVDVSTGSGKVYYQEGVRNVAHTPRGNYRVFYKIDGIRISKLGQLYKPSYFFQGYAIHGSPSVPAYPASHGCVRITNPEADRLFPLLTYGTAVHVYDE